MRAVTYMVGEPEAEAECYIAVLGGDGGGGPANFNRWARQMGESGVDQARFDSFETLELLGAAAPWAQFNGSYAGMSGEQLSDAALLGALAPMGPGTLFVQDGRAARHG